MSISAGTVALTCAALAAFAFNSVLTRLALGARQIDAATFTAIRLFAGAIALSIIVVARAKTWTPLRPRGITAPQALFAYAAPFSFAYLRIGAAVGALVLFAVVQMTMISYGVCRGERPPLLAWVGALLAAGGLLNLMLPATARPDLVGVSLMVVAGIAWGIYSIVGRTVADPVAANARNFLWSSAPAIILMLLSPRSIVTQPQGAALALVSGAVTSGLGYAIWYRVMPRLSAVQAGVAQLAVPVIAAIAAVALLGEQLSARLVVSSVAVLSGVAVVLAAKFRSTAS